MAYLKSITSGTTFTSASSWNLCDTNSLRGLSTTTTVGNSVVYGNAWTAGGNYTYVGWVLYCSAPAASGTLTIALFLSAGTTPLATVTINNTDLVVGYNYVKFTTPYSVTSGTQYRIGMNTGGGVVTTTLGVTAGTNFTGIVVTNTVQGIAVTDTFYVLGDLTGQGTNTTATITMDNTGTTLYGSTGGSSFPSIIGNKGTLQYGTSASTNYQLRMQNIIGVYNGGTFTMGTLASPIPDTSTAKLEFVCASANQYFLTIQGGTVTTYGATKTSSAKLAANLAVSATGASTDISTGWLSGDRLIIPPTNRTQTQFDTPTLNSNASGTDLVFTTGLTFAHETSPTTPTASDIINLTRNVSIFGQGSGLTGTTTTYITIGGGTVSLNYTQIYYVGNSSSAGTGGFISNVTNANSSVSLNGCSIWGSTTFTNYIFYQISTQATSTFSMTNSVVYGSHMSVGSNAAMTPSTVTYNNNVLLRGMFATNRLNITLTNMVAAGSASAGFAFNDAGITTTNGGIFGTVSGLTTYCNTSFGFSFYIPGGGTNVYASGTISNLNCWRNTVQGLYHIGSSPQPLLISGCTLTGNANANINMQGSGQIYFKNLTTNSMSTYTTPYAFTLGCSDKVYVVDSSLGGTTPETTAALLGGSNGQVFPINVSFYNTTFGHGTIVGTQSQLPGRSLSYGFSSMKHGGSANSTFNWQQFGTITTDSTIYNTSTFSMRMTPTSALWKMMSHPIKMAIAANNTVRISAIIRKSPSGGGETIYNGNQPRLVLAPTPLLDYGLNTVLATATGSTGVWETLTATFTPTVTGVYEFFLDCDGTTGYVNVDDWSTNYVTDTTKMDYWFLGMPDVNITGIPKERSNTFVY